MKKIKKQYTALVLCLAAGFLSTTAEAYTHTECNFPKCDFDCEITCDLYTYTPALSRYCKQVGSDPSVTESCYVPGGISFEGETLHYYSQLQRACLSK